MEKITANVVNVSVKHDELGDYACITLDTTVKGRKYNRDTRAYENDVDVSYISMSPYAITRDLSDVNDDIAFFAAMLGGPLGQAELGAILFRAKLTIEREFVAAGTEVNGKAREYDGYDTKIVDVALDKRGVAWLLKRVD